MLRVQTGCCDEERLNGLFRTTRRCQTLEDHPEHVSGRKTAGTASPREGVNARLWQDPGKLLCLESWGRKHWEGFRETGMEWEREFFPECDGQPLWVCKKGPGCAHGHVCMHVSHTRGGDRSKSQGVAAIN